MPGWLCETAQMLPNYLFSPLTFGLVVALGLAIAWRVLPRVLRYAGVIVELLLLVLMAPLGANALVRIVESRVPPAQACSIPAPATIVVLSGGLAWMPRGADDFSALDVSSLRRLLAGVALWRRTPGARLVFAGGGARVPESVLLAGLARQLGVPAAAIRTEQRSLTTWGNARYLAMESPHLPARIWLVSSALHLPRGLIAFRAAGFQPCPYSSDSSYVTPGGFGYFVPQSSSLIKTEKATHELIGGLVYALRAWDAKSARSPRQGDDRRGKKNVPQIAPQG